MPSFVTHNEVPRSPEAVFAFLCDLSQWTSFPGWGPIPAIVSAELPEGGPLGLGSRVRVTNSDRSVHHEIVEEFQPGRRLRFRMELSPPASRALSAIDERIDLEPLERGTRIVRRFELHPRSRWTAPLALVLRACLRRAVAAHDAAAGALLSRG